MSLKRFGLALFAVLVVGAVAANSAMATAVESNGFWYIGETKVEPGTEHVYRCDLPPAPPGPIVITASAAEVAVKLKATGLSCPSSSIFNQSSKAKLKVSLQLTGVSVAEPSSCKVEGGTIETAALAGQVWMEGSKVLIRYAPAEGASGTFAKFTLSGCSIAGSYAMKGTLFGEMFNATGVAAASQKMRFSPKINSAAGGTLSVAGNPVSVTIEEDTSKIEEGGSEFEPRET
jgi:hypothetical protein